MGHERSYCVERACLTFRFTYYRSIDSSCGRTDLSECEASSSKLWHTGRNGSADSLALHTHTHMPRFLANESASSSSSETATPVTGFLLHAHTHTQAYEEEVRTHAHIRSSTWNVCQHCEGLSLHSEGKFGWNVWREFPAKECWVRTQSFVPRLKSAKASFILRRGPACVFRSVGPMKALEVFLL